MATIADTGQPRVKPISTDAYERILSIAAIILFGVVVAAVVRGRWDWSNVGPAIWLHLGTIMVALALTPVMLLRRRGDTRHRVIGWVWMTAMTATALASFFVRNASHGNFSFIHILSAWTLIQVPLIIWTARHHQVARHRGAVRGLITGALLIAGFFTFPFNRMLGQWLFG